MTMNIEQISAYIEIQQLLYRYCRGVDRGDKALLASVYHDGAQDDHGSFKGSGADFAVWIVDEMDKSHTLGQHHITNMLIEVDGDTAKGESYFIAYHPSEVPGTGKESLALAGGRYLDCFEKRDGAWRITDRKVVIDFTRAPDPRNPWEAEPFFTQAGRREADPSHGFVAAR